MKKARGIANLIQELLRGVQNYISGISLTLEAAKSEILQSTTLIEHPSLKLQFSRSYQNAS